VRYKSAMNLNLELKTLLQEKFVEMKKRNQQISMRGFAKKIGISSGAITEILSGKRRVSHSMAEKIATSLMIPPIDRPWNYLSQQNYIDLDMKNFEVIKEWQHFAILSLIKTEGFKSDEKWIARRLGISTVEVSLAIKNLISVGLLQKTKSGHLVRQIQDFQTSNDVSSLAIQMSHLEGLKLAAKSLENDPIANRDFSSITFAINPKKLKEAKELIKKFQNQISEVLESKPQKEVYKLCIQLFPITKS
jgi:transcriptional regulator with XRE-family HTH domain